MSAVTEWLDAEWNEYASVKWAEPGAEKAHRDCVVGEGPTTWHDWAGNYIKRAAMFGLDSPQGRQALGKAIVTLTHVLETAVEEYGPMPKPGVPSGDRVPISKRIRWWATDAAEIIWIVLVAVGLALLCAVVIGLAVRASFWAAGIGW